MDTDPKPSSAPISGSSPSSAPSSTPRSGSAGVPPTGDPGRRHALRVIGTVGAGACVAATAPWVAGHVLAPGNRPSSRGPSAQNASSHGAATSEFVVGAAGQLSETPLLLAVVGDQVDGWTRATEQVLGHVWVRKNNQGEVQALNAECPHLGCRIGFQKQRGHFQCPCHESAFGLDGTVLEGPSPRPLDSLHARVHGGKVRVQFKRFQTQTSEKVPLGTP